MIEVLSNWDFMLEQVLLLFGLVGLVSYHVSNGLLARIIKEVKSEG